MKWHDAVSFRFEGDADAAVTYVPMARKLLGMFKHEISLGANLGTMVRRWTLLDGPEGQATITAHAFATHDIVTIDAVRPAGPRKKTPCQYEPSLRVEVWSGAWLYLWVWEPAPSGGLIGTATYENGTFSEGRFTSNDEGQIVEIFPWTTDTRHVQVGTGGACANGSGDWDGNVVATRNNLWMFQFYLSGFGLPGCGSGRHEDAASVWKHFDELKGVETADGHCVEFAVCDPFDPFLPGKPPGGLYAVKAMCKTPDFAAGFNGVDGAQGAYIVRLGAPGCDQYVYRVPLRISHCGPSVWEEFLHTENPHSDDWDQGAVLIDVANGAVTVEENYIPHMGFAASSG